MEKTLKRSIRQRLDTSRLYRFEENSVLLESFRRQVSKSTLLKFANRYHNLSSCPLAKAARPRISFGRGIKSGRRYLSYYDPNTHEIVLSKGQRDKITLLHELIHADRPELYHDKYFVDTEIRILHLLGLDAQKLKAEAASFGLHVI
jgi:hypothetical protein